MDKILIENDNSINLSEESQQEVDSLATEKDSLLAEWKVVVKQVEDENHNEQKRQQIKAQEERLVTLAEQKTRQVVVIQGKFHHL